MDEEHGVALCMVQCAWCRAFFDAKPGALTMITHGICADCLKKMLNNIDK
jgi:hypothetical protein